MLRRSAQSTARFSRSRSLVLAGPASTQALARSTSSMSMSSRRRKLLKLLLAASLLVARLWSRTSRRSCSMWTLGDWELGEVSDIYSIPGKRHVLVLDLHGRTTCLPFLLIGVRNSDCTRSFQHGSRTKTKGIPRLTRYLFCKLI